MIEMKEKISIEFTEIGVLIKDNCQTCLRLTAGEALMLLDILKNEQDKLKKIADDASLIQITI